MRTSVIILTRDRVEDLADCLRALAAQTVVPDEVILVDNSSDTVTYNYVDQARGELAFSVLYNRGYPSLGTATGRNRAVDRAQGEIVFFLDDDVVLIDPQHIATILSIFHRDEGQEIGGVGWPGSPLTLGRRLKHCPRIALKTLFVLDCSHRCGRVLPSGFRSWWPSRTAWVQCLPGGTSAWRRVVFDEFRFDPGFENMPYAMCEDQDFSYRVGRRWKLLWTSTVTACHKKSAAGGRLTQYEHYLSLVCNHDYFMRKNLGRAVNHLAFWWAMVGVFLNCLALLVVRPTRDRFGGLLGFLQGVRQVGAAYHGS